MYKGLVIGETLMIHRNKGKALWLEQEESGAREAVRYQSLKGPKRHIKRFSL